ncbi:hypothetical protein L1887_04339 [Cichorium endivia]|nr:hypothetical protein L1887_04339 [Cichorium endivia]
MLLHLKRSRAFCSQSFTAWLGTFSECYILHPAQAVKKDSSSEEESNEEDDEDDSSDEDEKPAKSTKKIGGYVEMVYAPSGKKAPQTPATPEATGSKTFFMGNLIFQIREADVSAGEVVEVRFAMRDDRFAGYAHVEFATPDAAQEALKLHEELLLDRPVRLDLPKERGAFTTANPPEVRDLSKRVCLARDSCVYGPKENNSQLTNQPTEQLYKRLDGAWTETKATSEKVKETLGIGKPESTESSSSSANESSGTKDDERSTDKEDKKQESGHASCVLSFFVKICPSKHCCTGTRAKHGAPLVINI